jgi:hypothetical protein
MDVALLAPLPVGVVRWTADEALLCVVVKVTFSLAQDGVAALAEEQRPLELDRSSASPSELSHASDFTPLKPRADVLFVGHVHAEEPTCVAHAAFSIGWLRRSFVAMSALPSASIPLHRAHLRASAAPGASVVPLSPFAPMTPERRALANDQTFDATGLPTGPLVLDRGYFNAASPDHQVDFFRGDETIVLEGLLASSPHRVVTLPGVCPRVHVADRATLTSDELQLCCDTLAIDVDAELCTLTWRGTFQANAFADPCLVVSFEAEDEAAARDLSAPALHALLGTIPLSRAAEASARARRLPPRATARQYTVVASPLASPEGLAALAAPDPAPESLAPETRQTTVVLSVADERPAMPFRAKTEPMWSHEDQTADVVLPNAPAASGAFPFAKAPVTPPARAPQAPPRRERPKPPREELTSDMPMPEARAHTLPFHDRDRAILGRETLPIVPDRAPASLPFNRPPDPVLKEPETASSISNHSISGEMATPVMPLRAPGSAPSSPPPKADTQISEPDALLPIERYAAIRVELTRAARKKAVLARYGFDDVTWKAQERLQAAAIEAEAWKGSSARATALMEAMDAQLNEDPALAR